MPQTYEKDGIIYFKEPYEVDYADWIFEHLDCDCIITEESVHSDMICVLCFAKDENFNSYLRHIQKTKYPNGKIFRGMGAEEVNCID